MKNLEWQLTMQINGRLCSSLPIGNIAMRKARAQFSANFFGCAGYQIIDKSGFDTAEEAADAALILKPTLL